MNAPVAAPIVERAHDSTPDEADATGERLARAINSLAPTTDTLPCDGLCVVDEECAAETCDAASEELDKPIHTRWLLKFTLPTIISYMLFGAFGMIDGIFAARVIDPLALGAVSIVWPFVSFAMAIGFTFSMGGAALVGKKIGEGKYTEARANFSMLTVITIVASAVISLVALAFPDALLSLLGVDDVLRPMAMEYLVPILAVLPLAVLGFYVQQYFVTEGKPSLGFLVTAVGGVFSVSLNFLFIWHWGWGLRGAALSTGIGWAVPAFIGMWFFVRNRTGTLYLTRPTWDLRALGKSTVNGATEAVTMLAGSVTLVMMNNIVIDLAGPQGVAAVAIMFVGTGLLMQTLLGYAYGVAPIVSFNFGLGDRDRLRRLFKRSLVIMVSAAAAAIALGWLLTAPLVSIYVGPGEIHDLATRGFRIGLLGMVFMAVNGFASVLFTALNNGVVSGILSIFRTLVFVVAMLLLLPRVLGMDGVWLALPAAELLAMGMALWYFWRKAKVYGFA